MGEIQKLVDMVLCAYAHTDSSRIEAKEEAERAEEAEAAADREALRASRRHAKRFRLGRKRNGGRKPRRAY